MFDEQLVRCFRFLGLPLGVGSQQNSETNLEELLDFRIGCQLVLFEVFLQVFTLELAYFGQLVSFNEE